MRRDEFQKRTRQWPSTHKRDVLGVQEDGIWPRNGSRSPHILPNGEQHLNILPSFRNDFWAWFRSQHPRVRLQRDFHHLNSSQALCFNLFFPLMTGDGQRLVTLLSAMGMAGSPKAGASFEFQPDPEEGTCIDFSLPLQSGARVNFEVKYTESEFGSVKADNAHSEKFKTTYQPRLAGRFEKSFCCEARFLRHYQIARNVWHLNEAAGDIAVFLFPRANTCLRQEEETIRTCAVEPFRSRIHILYLEDLIRNLSDQLPPSETAPRQYLLDFHCKYLSFLEMQTQG